MGEKPEHSASADSQAMKNAKLLSKVFQPPVSYGGIPDKTPSATHDHKFIPLAEMLKRIETLDKNPPPAPPKEAEQVPLSYFINEGPAYSGEAPPSKPSGGKHPAHRR